MKAQIEFQKLLGMFIGTLEAIQVWDIPQELREKLENEIIQLREGKVEVSEWIDANICPPEPNKEIIAVLDYTPYGRKKRILMATTHHTAEGEYIEYGGPNALTGRGKLTGLYYAIPAILKPGIVTHYRHIMPLPENCKDSELLICQAASDGECFHAKCPQNRDHEPEQTGRPCPLPDFTNDNL